MLQLNKIDIHQIQSVNLGIIRTPFDRVMEVSGFSVRPVEGDASVWDFHHTASGEKGRLLHMEGFLGKRPVAVNGRGQAYLITRQGFTLALMFPSAPRRMKLNQANFKVLPPIAGKHYPQAWPAEMVSKVIRSRFRTIVLLDEAYLLKKIGLREPDIAI